MSRASPLVARAVLLATLALMLYALIVCAWQCDDAYLTFRTARNLVTGRGLTWNPGDRVQVFTHPLWMALSAIAFAITREHFVSMNVIAIATSLAAAAMLAWLARERFWIATACIAALVASRAFVDFAVSGLENPLLALIIAFAAHASARGANPRRDLLVTLASSAAFLTRPDAVLLLLPAWIACIARPHRSWRAIAFGAAPALAWECFSLVYYGALVPNTALAKLNLAVPRSLLLSHGFAYLRDSLRRDPLTLTATAGAVLFATFRGNRTTRALALGVPLYLAFVVWVGGDFMSGRFLGAPLFLALSAACLAPTSETPRWSWRAEALIAVCVLAWALGSPRSPARSGFRYGRGFSVAQVLDAHGIADERAYYYPFTGFLPTLVLRDDLVARGVPIPPYRGALRGLTLAHDRIAGRVAVYNEAGYFGYFAGDHHIVEPHALGDAFLARIPYRATERFRIGHYARQLPRGYLESVERGRNVITDPQLHAAYDAVHEVTHGALFTRRRWRAIIDLARGRYDAAFASAR